MSKIMELAVEIAHETSEWTRNNPMGKAGRKYTDVPSYAALQAEVTRMEQEIEEAQTLKNLLFICRQERDELRAKLAALEAQEPFAWSIFDGEGGEYFVAYEYNETYKADYEIRNPNHLNWVKPLYTAAGAKQESAKPDALDALGSAWMKLCPTCGNKRCPKATDAALDCTGSNEAGQLGSSWENVKPFGAKEKP